MNPKLLNYSTAEPNTIFYQLLREQQGLVLVVLPLQEQLSLTVLMHINILTQISKMFSLPNYGKLL